MRISTSQIFRQGISSITSQQTQLAQTQLQLASGKRLLSPADDPAGSTEALRFTERIAVTRQHQENLDFARTRLNQEAGSVARAVEVLQRRRGRGVRLAAVRAPVIGKAERVVHAVLLCVRAARAWVRARRREGAER